MAKGGEKYLETSPWDEKIASDISSTEYNVLKTAIVITALFTEILNQYILEIITAVQPKELRFLLYQAVYFRRGFRLSKL